MSTLMKFEKWEGLGNDFVILLDPGVDLDDRTVGRLCDRRLGIGADGVLVVETRGLPHPRMIVRNADGSRPEMCGNGLRCVAAFLAGASGGARHGLVVSTDAGEKTCDVDPAGVGAFDVHVDMGTAKRGADLAIDHDGRPIRFLTLDLGNPHAVTFDLFDDAQLERIASHVAARTPGGTNVELCASAAAEIEVLVWERGVGRTLACGTGACAVAVAACATGRARHDQAQRIRLPGGALTITVSSFLTVGMLGPARRVFAGDVGVGDALDALDALGRKASDTALHAVQSSA